MSGDGASTLSLIAAAGYGILVLACLAASLLARRSPTHPKHVLWWAMIAVFFALLAVSRIFDLEETLRDVLRDHLRQNDSYNNRGAFQMPLTIGVGVIALGFMVWLVVLWRKAISRRAQSLLVAVIGVCAMLSLIALRNISFSAFDKLLYGPLKLNWVGDIGSASLVLGAAVYYAYVVRTSLSSGERSQ